MMTQKQTDPQQAAMQSMMQFMPLMIGVFSWGLEAGLPLYWAVSTLFSIVQQYFIMARRAKEPDEILPKGKPRGNGMRGRIAGRLAEMQKPQSTSEKTRSQAPKQGLRGSPSSSGRTRGQPLPHGGAPAGGKRAGGSSAGGAKSAQGGGQQRVRGAGGSGEPGASKGSRPQGQGGARDGRNRKKRRKR